MQDLDIQAPARPADRPPRVSWGQRVLQPLRPHGERAALWLHRQAERMDLVPAEFGRDAAVDETDGGALAREWLRQARLWADYNPEEMLALKAGAVALGAALLIVVVLVGALG